MRKLLKKIFNILYYFLIIVWILSFCASYSSYMMNSPISIGFSLSEINIRGINVLLLLSILLIIFHIVSSTIKKHYDIKDNCIIYIKYLVKYIFFILETTVGIYVSTLVFSYEYTNFNPKIVFILVGLILFYILERLKEKFNSYLSGGTS